MKKIAISVIAIVLIVMAIMSEKNEQNSTLAGKPAKMEISQDGKNCTFRLNSGLFRGTFPCADAVNLH